MELDEGSPGKEKRQLRETTWVMVESPPKKVGQEIDLEDPLYLAPPVCFTTVYYVFYASLVLTTVLLLLTT